MLAADADDFTGHVRRVVAGEEHDHVGDLPGLGRSPERLARRELLEQLVGRHLGEERVHGDARRHGIHAHIERRRLDRRAPRERHHAGFGRGIVRLPRLRTPAQHRRVVDDHAVALRLQEAQGRPHASERTVEGDVENLCPLLVGHVDDVGSTTEAGVVHDDVEAVELLDRGLEQPLHVGLVRHVAHRRRDTELGGGLGQSPLVSIAHDDARALLDASLRSGETDAGARRGGDEHALAGEQFVTGDVVHAARTLRDQVRRFCLTASRVSSLTPRPSTYASTDR